PSPAVGESLGRVERHLFGAARFRYAIQGASVLDQKRVGQMHGRSDRDAVQALRSARIEGDDTAAAAAVIEVLAEYDRAPVVDDSHRVCKELAASRGLQPARSERPARLEQRLNRRIEHADVPLLVASELAQLSTHRASDGTGSEGDAVRELASSRRGLRTHERALETGRRPVEQLQAELPRPVRHERMQLLKGGGGPVRVAADGTGDQNANGIGVFLQLHEDRSRDLRIVDDLPEPARLAVVGRPVAEEELP